MENIPIKINRLKFKYPVTVRERIPLSEVPAQYLLNTYSPEIIKQMTQSYYNAYVEFPEIVSDEIYEELQSHSATYHYAKIIGVDTNHLYNDTMTPEEKLTDALKQILEVIRAYDSLNEKKKRLD